LSRLWQEGFEAGFPNSEFLTGNPTTDIRGWSMPMPEYVKLANGRGDYSQYSLELYQYNYWYALTAVYSFENSLDEFYFRCYYKSTIDAGGDGVDNCIFMLDGSANVLISLCSNGEGVYQVKVRVGGVLTSYEEFTLNANTWYRVEWYFKVDSSTGAYEVKIDGQTVSSGSGLNTGTNNVTTLKLGAGFAGAGGSGLYQKMHFDDLAVNDTTGTKNLTWCGAGTIVGLKPNDTGNKSQWNTSEGWTSLETNSGTTQVVITDHGLTNADIIYNVTRDTYKTVSYSDSKTLLCATIAGQTVGDIVVAYQSAGVITAGAGTSTAKVVISGHGLESYDVIMNLDRSNAIRKVLYTNGNDVYNYEDLAAGYTDLGSSISGQASGDDIATYTVKYYDITNHYETCNQASPNPRYSYIESTVSGHIDTFDMEELITDKSVPDNASIVAVSHTMYLREAGAGSEVRPVFRIGSTDYTGSNIELSGDVQQYQQIFEESPATSNAWLISEVDSCEAGVEVV
jgi:hypothetical protein